MTSNVIDTKSKLFKLYAARRMRTEPFVWNMEDVLDEKTNICHYVRNIFFECIYQFVYNCILVAIGVCISIMILAPILSIGFWLFTNNPFIPFFGLAGVVAMFIDCVILFFLGLYGIIELFKYVKPRFRKKESGGSLSSTDVLSTWIKSVHGKFCVPLKYDRKSKNSDDEDQMFGVRPENDWPRE